MTGRDEPIETRLTLVVQMLEQAASELKDAIDEHLQSNRREGGREGSG